MTPTDEPVDGPAAQSPVDQRIISSDRLSLLRLDLEVRFDEESLGYSKDQVDRVMAGLAPLADDVKQLQSSLGYSSAAAPKRPKRAGRTSRFFGVA